MKNDRRKTKHYLWYKAVFYQALVVVFLLMGMGGNNAAHAQLVNGDFESECSGTIRRAFQGASRCVTGPWFASHGTPDIYQNENGNITKCARIGAKPSYQEGIFIQCPTFTADKTYRCSLRVSKYSAFGIANLVIALANGLHHSSGAGTFPTGQTSVIIRTSTSISTTSWQTITFDFAPTANFQQLWFYAEQSSAGETGGILIDDVDVIEICLATATYNTFSGTPAVTERSDYIRAYGTSTVSTGQTITYKAGNYVQLQPNFHAAPGGGFFHAYIGPCSPPPLQPCTDNVIGPIPKHGVGAESLPLPDMGEELLSNYPNPFTGKTTIQYRVAGSAPVVLEVVNIFGEHVAELLHNETRSAGVHSLEFDASALPRGVYYLVLRSGTATATKKMVVVP